LNLEDVLAPGTPGLGSLLGNPLVVQAEFGQAFGTGDDHKEALNCQLSAVSKQPSARFRKIFF
jgi:hypothetical protein